MPAAISPWRAACGRGALLLALAAALPAHAGLFDDDEARKAILDLRARITAADDASKARSAELATTNAQLAEQVQQLKRSLLDLNNQLELLRAEMARMRGNDEQLARDVSEIQRRQKDLAQGVDERVRKLEPQKVSVDGKEFLADADEKRLYEEAMALLRSGDFDKAASALSTFARRYPASGYGDSVRYWLGNAQYGRKDYKEAIASFRAFVAAAPEHARAPEALLAIANCQAEMKDVRSARRTIDELIKAYPKSEAAVAGKERLATLKG
jgi:tol-pal system protein YbgF